MRAHRTNGSADPTKNVLDLVDAEALRQDDLREAEGRRQDDLREQAEKWQERLDKERVRADNEAKRADTEAKHAEASRIDAVLAGQLQAATVTNERLANAATALAGQVASTAEAMRNQVAAAAQQQTELLGALRDTLGGRLTTVETYQATGGGRDLQRSEGRTDRSNNERVILAVLGLIVAIFFGGLGYIVSRPAPAPAATPNVITVPTTTPSSR